MRSRQPAGSATTIARDHFPTIVEQDRKVRFPAAIAIHPDHGEAYDRVFRIPSRMTGALRGFRLWGASRLQTLGRFAASDFGALRGFRLCFWFSTSLASDRPPSS